MVINQQSCPTMLQRLLFITVVVVFATCIERWTNRNATGNSLVLGFVLKTVLANNGVQPTCPAALRNAADAGRWAETWIACRRPYHPTKLSPTAGRLVSDAMLGEMRRATLK